MSPQPNLGYWNEAKSISCIALLRKSDKFSTMLHKNPGSPGSFPHLTQSFLSSPTYLQPLSRCCNMGHFMLWPQQQGNIFVCESRRDTLPAHWAAPRKSKGKGAEPQVNSLHADPLESLPCEVRALTHSSIPLGQFLSIFTKKICPASRFSQKCIKW